MTRNPSPMSTKLSSSLKRSDTRRIEMDKLLEMENKNASKNTVSQLTFQPWRVFINHVDSYHGKKLADFLLSQPYCHLINSPSIDTKGDLIGDDVVDDIEVDNSMLTMTETMSEEQVTRNYEITGTLSNNGYQAPKNIRIVDVDNKDILLKESMSCGYVIYDITLDDDQIEQARWTVKAIAKELENASKLKSVISSVDNSSNDTRYFMLISNIMTWAQTKTLDPENPHAPFTEADYAKRKAHENFTEHIRCENDVILIEKRYNLSLKFKTLVLCCGITYGDEEGPLNFLFNMAWNNPKFLPIFGNGANKIPLLHVTQLTIIVQSLLHCWPKQVRYLVATELDLISQTTVVEKISKAFANGQIKYSTRDELNQFTDVSAKDYDIITVNVNIESAYTLDKCIQSNMTFEMNFDNVVKEYRIFRNLLPLKLIIFGPPAVGKTTLSKRLANYYCIPYLNVESLITQTIQCLTIAIQRTIHVNDEEVQNNNMGSDNVDDELCELDYTPEDLIEDCVLKRAQLLEQINEICKNLAENNGRLDDHVLNKILAKRLMSTKCQNQGYVLDGYPETLAQTRGLFEYPQANNDLKNNNIDWPIKNNSELKNIMPEFVIVLEASDEFLVERVMNLTEREIQRTHHDMESIVKRLREYRKQNTQDNTNASEYFAMNKVPILIVPIVDECAEMHSSFQRCLEAIGKPRNLGPIRTEISTVNIMTVRDETPTHVTSPASGIHREEEFIEKQQEHNRMMMKLTDRLEKIHDDEEYKLQQLSEPLHSFLVNNVLPILTEGLIELVRIRPNDPIDFLAEFLFKNNPDGKMLESQNLNEIKDEQSKNDN